MSLSELRARRLRKQEEEASSQSSSSQNSRSGGSRSGRSNDSGTPSQSGRTSTDPGMTVGMPTGQRRTDGTGRTIKYTGSGSRSTGSGTSRNDQTRSTNSSRGAGADPLSGMTIKPDANGNYSYGQLLGIAASGYERDPEKATQLLTTLRGLESDRTSMYYKPYNQPTNPAVAALAALGVDVSNINDDWFSANSYLKQYYKTTANTNGLSSTMTNKKASTEEKMAYYYNQLWMEEETTKKAERERDKLYNDLGYWASQTDRDYSDEELLARVDWSKYPTLKKMRESAAAGTPIELNRAVYFDDDAMQAVLWMARNPEYKGGLEGAMANMALGYGNTYKADAKIAAMRDKNSADYAPYTAGCTMDEERAFFGVPYFPKDWTEKNKHILTDGTEEERKHYINVAEGEEITLAAESELEMLYKRVNKKLSRIDSREKAEKYLDQLLDSGEFPTLVKMDKTIERGYYTKDKDTMGLTRAVPYRKADMLAYMTSHITGNATLDDISYADDAVASAAGANAQNSFKVTPDGLEFVQPMEPLPENIIEGTASLDDIQRYADSLITDPEKPSAGASVPKEYLLGSSGGAPAPGDRGTPGNILEENRRKAFDEKHGEGEYDRVMALARGETPPQNEPSMSEQTAAVYKQQDETLTDGLDMADGALTPSEDEYMDAAGSTVFEYVTDRVTAIKDKGAAAAKNLATKSASAVRQSHTDAVLGSLQDIYDYETNQEKLDSLRLREAELLKKTEGKEYVGQERQDTVYRPIERDGKRYEVALGWNYWENTYMMESVEEIGANGDRLTVEPEDWMALRESDEVAKAVRDSNDVATKIEEQNRDVSGLSEEDKQAAKELQSIQLQIQDTEAYLTEHQSQYEAAAADFDNDQKRYQQSLWMLEQLGVDTSDLEKSEAAVGYLTQFHDYDATVWSRYNPSQMYADAIAAGEDREAVLAAAKKGDDELKGELDTALAVKEYIQESGLNVPPEYLSNLDRHIAKLQRNHQDYEFFALSDRKDFEAVAQKGREMEFEARPIAKSIFGTYDAWGGSMEKYYADQMTDRISSEDLGVGLQAATMGLNRFMTKDELDTYYYLLGSGDTEKAQEYVRFMTDMTYGVLWTRQREQTEQAAREMTDAGFGGFLGSNALAVLMNPVAAITSAMYYGYNAATGNELNPDAGILYANHWRNATRDESAKVISNEFGEGTWQQKVAQAGYEIVSNRLDSVANQAVFGGLFGGAGEGASFIQKALSETASALPMGISASMDAAADAKRKGASDAQAYGIAAVTLFAETVTEGFSIDNMREAFELGSDIGADTVKDFLKNWLTKAGISEMAGESLNDIIENYADEKIMGELSDHADRVWDYRMKGMGKDEAEAAARKDELNGVLRTALISYLSPGLDIVSTGAGRYSYWMNVTREHQQAGDNRSVLEIMRGVKKAQADLENAGAVMDGSASQEALVSGYEILDNAKNGSETAKTAAMSAVLNGVAEGRGLASKAIADAAAVRMSRLMGKHGVVQGTQELVMGAAVGKVDSGALTQALQNAALSPSSEAAKVMKRRAYRNGTPETKAQMLAATVEADAKNPNVTNEIVAAVHENRVNEETKKQIAAGALNGARPAVTKSREAMREARVAESQLEDRQEERKAAQEAVKTANEAVQENPQEGAAVMAEALNKLNSTSAVEQEYAQKEQKAKQKEKDAKEEANRAVAEGMSQIRAESETRVAVKEQAEAQAAADAEALAQQQAAEAQAAQEAQEASDNALDADADAFIEDNYPDATDEEKQHIREMFGKNRPAESNQDTDRQKFFDSVSKKFGVNIVEAEQTAHNANGYYDPKTNTITLNKNATVGDALYFVLGHELTHITEQAGEYNRLADSILGLAFGKGTTYQGILDDMKAGRSNSPLARMVNARRATYEQATGESYGNDYYLQEIVADNLGMILKGDPNNPQVQQDLINRLVTEEPTTARKILDGIKSFLKRAVGMRGAWQTDMQNTVDLFTKALSNAQKGKTVSQSQTEQTGEAQPTTPQEAVQKAAETGEAQPLPDRQGNETAADVLRGNTVALDETKLSLNSFNESEQERTRAALLSLRDESGKRQYTPEQVDKYMQDALGIAAMIAQDRGRLDFEATDNPLMSFLKKNQDYGFTLDASTLCAKRLLYQGTFNYVQHALPNEVFLPEDLIELVNIMNEMGYEVPCGICYVESRRRWLDKYTNEFLTETLKNPEPFIKKQFRKASAEEKAAIRERLSPERLNAEGGTPSIDDLTTTDGLEKVRKNDPYMYKAFVAAMNAKGSANPKVVQPRTEYKGEISKLTDKQIQELKDIGGLRVQSFSDFETPHLLDMIQAVYDMAARGLTSQAYTKVPNFAWVFGDTGIKINLSLIGKGRGVDDNGNLMFDNKEGMDFDEAMKLRDRYNKNVGTILVGINDDHIIAAMGDPRIDFIIPFHQSGWSEAEMKGVSTLQYYEDFTDFQNERVIVGKETIKSPKAFNSEAEANEWIRTQQGKGKTKFTKETTKNGKIVVTASGYKIESFTSEGTRLGIPESKQRKNFEPVGAHQYWDFNLSGQANAEKYLQMCAEDGRMPKFWEFLVDNGDGSFSLPQGDDKRSTAIREGYWKTLTDFKMYENDGYGRAGGEVRGAAQQKVSPNVNMDQARRVMNEYTLNRPSGNKNTKMVDRKNNNDVPVATTAAEEFIRRIREKRAGRPLTPAPNDPMEASPEINVTPGSRMSTGVDPNFVGSGTAAGAYAGDMTGGNTPSTNTEEFAAQQQNAMAIDAETGETVGRRYSLPANDQEEETLRTQYRASQQTELDLRDRKNQIEKSEEMKSWESRMVNARGDELKALLAEYKQWETDSGYADIAKNYEAARKATKNALKALDDYVEQRNVREEQEKIAASGLSEPDWRRKEAVKEFGYTTNVNEAGYMLPNGKMLNFTGEKGKHYGYRGQDHRAIGTIYASQEKQHTAAMNAFMNDGNIRLMPESPGIDVSNAIEPTAEQYSGIRSMIRSLANKEYFSVDLSDQSGRVIGTLEYEGRVHPDRVVNDIKTFFRTGEVPQQSGLDRFRYSLPADAPYMAAVERGEMDQAQQMVDEKAREAGYTLEAFHGTGEYFNVFNRGAEGIHLGNEEQAKQVANLRYETRSKMNTYKWDDIKDSISKMTPEQRESLVRNAYFTQDYFDDGQSVGEFDGDINDADAVYNYANGIYSRYEAATQDKAGVYMRTIDRKTGENVMHLYAKINNPFIINGDIGQWTPVGIAGVLLNRDKGITQIKDNTWDEESIIDISGSALNLDDAQREEIKRVRSFKVNREEQWDILSSVLGELGYDGIQYRNTYEGDRNSYSYIALKQSDVKSADPVTYDENGNVIPLSERFNDASDDIRYQLPDDSVLERQIREYLANGGRLNRPTQDGQTATPDRPQKQRQYGSQRAEGIPLWHDETIKHLKENSAYDPDANREQVDRAFNWIQSHATEDDQTGYYGAVQELESEDFNFATADGQARMIVTMAMAAVKANNGDAGAQNDEIRLNDAFNRQGTNIAQALQARQIYFMLTPKAKQHNFQREIDKINADYKRKGKDTKVELPQNLMDDLVNAKTDDELDAALKAARKNIASQMPANWKEKLQAWRMFAMLGNPRTHIRNILGNAIFMPVVGMKNKVGAFGEIITRQKTRTKTLGLASPEARAFAKEDSLKREADLRGDKKYNEGSKIQQERKAFGQGKGFISRTLGKGIQAAMDFSSNKLEQEDWIFLRRHYRNALAGYMTANKLTAADMTGKTLNDARAYAINEAQKATYRDANEIANWLNNVKNPAARFVVNAVLPFKKTPANILKRGIEYSPAGLLYSAAKGAAQLKSGKITANEYIDKISAGLTGTGIMTLGAILSAIGAASAGLGDDDDEFDKLQGKQEYALNLFGQNVSYTVDWAAPVCMPFFVGAAIMDTYKNQPDISLSGVLDAILGITEPVFNLSMLDGVNSLLDVSQYAEGNAFTQIGEKVLTNYATSYVPSLVGQVARTMDTTRRKSYVESGTDLSTFRYAWEGLENKLPYLSTTNIPYRDVWGNAETSSTGEALIENFISPGYANQIKNDPVTTELKRIYNAEGVTDENRRAVVPKAAGKTIGSIKLNAEQYDQYVVSRGQAARETLEGLMESPFWQISDDNSRAKMVADAWTYANQIGQNTVTGRKLTSWVLEAQTSGDVVKTIVSRTADSNRDDYITNYSTALAEAIDNDSDEDIDTCMAALEEADADPKEIRAGLRNYFKPLYQKAYMDNDDTRMEEISDGLILAGVGFKSKDFLSWVPGVDEEEDEIDEDWLNR